VINKNPAADARRTAEAEEKKKQAAEKAKKEAELKKEAAKSDPKLALQMKRDELMAIVEAKGAKALADSQSSHRYHLKLGTHELSDRMLVQFKKHTILMEAVFHRHVF
jgi:hypothetical protein